MLVIKPQLLICSLILRDRADMTERGQGPHEALKASLSPTGKGHHMSICCFGLLLYLNFIFHRKTQKATVWKRVESTFTGEEACFLDFHYSQIPDVFVLNISESNVTLFLRRKVKKMKQNHPSLNNHFWITYQSSEHALTFLSFQRKWGKFFLFFKSWVEIHRFFS